MNLQPGQPKCFGTNLWSATVPACVGGPDAGYVHPVNTTRNREKCKWYQACASASGRARAQTTVIPPQNLVRTQPQPTMAASVQPPPRPVAPHPSLSSARPPLHQPQPQYQQPQYAGQYQQPAQQGPVAPPFVAQAGPAHVPIQQQWPGAQMPAYLSMPEPIDPNEGAAKPLGRTLVRSAFKALGHSFSSFFDNTSLKPHKPPEQ